jgi:HlyD family secretion protein
LPALDQTIELAVQYVSPLGEYATWRATRTGEADLRTFEVRARPVAKQPNWRAGMSVLLSVEPSNG